MNKELQEDLKEINRRLEYSANLKPPGYVQESGYHLEYFPIFDLTGQELKETGLIINWRAHLAGIRHKTVNVLLITEEGELILQQRASNTIFFPSRYTLSAGGHVSHETPDEKKPIDPIDKLMDEIQEELGLYIDSDRFVALGDPEKGIANFLHAWSYHHDGDEAMIVVFDPSARHIGLSTHGGAKVFLSDEDRAFLIDLVRQETLGKISEESLHEHNLKLFTRNIELCHFYTVVITKAEIMNIRFADGEVAGFRLVALDELINAGRSLDTTTDSLYTLFYARDDIAQELKDRIKKAKRVRLQIRKGH